MARALSGRGPLVTAAVLLVLAGGIAVAAAVRATPQPPQPQLGPPVVLAPSTATQGTQTRTGDEAASSHRARHTEHGDEPEVVGPAPIQEHDDDEAAEATGTSTHG